MSRENVETARRILEAWAGGDFATGVPAFAPHAVLVVSPDFGEWGVFVGEDQIREYTLRFMEQYEQVTIEPTGFREVGDTVLVSVVQRGEGRASGIDMSLPYFVLITFRGGKIVRMESILDESEARDAVGLRGP
jgi:ketosteroid isomerase-like protein